MHILTNVLFYIILIVSIFIERGIIMDNQEDLLSSCTEKLTKELPVLRKMCNLTQKNLGDLVGVSRQTITNIESGKCEMKWTLFLALILLFNMDKNCAAYIREMDMPYQEVKDVLAGRVNKSVQIHERGAI